MINNVDVVGDGVGDTNDEFGTANSVIHWTEYGKQMAKPFSMEKMFIWLSSGNF